MAKGIHNVLKFFKCIHAKVHGSHLFEAPQYESILVHVHVVVSSTLVIRISSICDTVLKFEVEVG